MKYSTIYQIVRDEKGEIADLINVNEFTTQEKAAKWLEVNQSTVSRATCKEFTNKQLANVLPIHRDGEQFLIIRG